jgi:PAS domain S-box-containing protein
LQRTNPLAHNQDPWVDRTSGLNVDQDESGNLDFPNHDQIPSRMGPEGIPALLHRALESVREAVFLIDENARIRYVNQESCRFLGYSPQELVSLTVADLDPDFPPERWPSHWRDLKAQRSLSFEGRHRAKDGRVFPVEIKANYFEHDGQDFNLALVRDISGRKRMEDALFFVAQGGWMAGEANFFDALARFLGESLDVDFVVIDRIDENPGFAETVALFAKGAIAPNLRYALKGTPCENVMGRRLCVYPQDAQRLFPEDTLLIELGVESYIGIPLWDSSGQPIGLIALMGTKPLADAETATQMLQLVATRAAAELVRERSDRILRAREHGFRTLAESLPDNVVRYDREGRTVYVNPVLEQTLGVAAAAMIGTTIRELNPDGSFEAYAQAVDAALSRGENGEIEILAPGPHPESRVHQIRIIAERDERGAVTGALGIGRDITETKKAEREHRANLHFFESMDKVNLAIHGESDPDRLMSEVLDLVMAVFECDRAFLMYPCDPEAPTWRVPMERNKPEHPGASAQHLEMPMDQDVAQTLRELLASDGPLQFGPGTDHPLPEEVAQRFGFRSFMSMAICPKVGKPWQFGIHQCSRPRVWTAEEAKLFREIGRRLGDALGILLAHRDLEESENRYRRITEGLTDYQYSVRVEGGRPVQTTQGPTCAAVTGYTPEDFESDPGLWIRMVAPEDRELVLDRVRKLLEGNAIAPVEHRIHRKDGMIRWVRDTTILQKDGSGNLLSYDGVIKDITDQKNAETALQEREQELSTIFQNAPFIMLLLDSGRKIRRANHQAYEFTHSSEQQILSDSIGKSFHCLHAFDVLEGCGHGPHCLECGFRTALDDSLHKGISLHQKEIRLSTSVDEKVNSTTFLLSTTPVTVGNQAMVLVSLEDVTEYKKLEATLLHSQKMEAIGQLAGGVAHDFNNLLTAIIGFGNLAKMKTRPGDSQDTLIGQILDAAERAAHLTQGLLAFSRKQVILPKPVDINNIVKSIEKLLRRIIGEDIDFRALLAKQDLILMADAGQIEQVLMNLATNARDAMPDGGSLTLSTEAVLLGKDFVDAHGYGTPGRYALITVSDSGTGMDEATQKKIFDPFFTTKEQGKGTGLGLSIVYGIIKQHDGAINIYSEPGKGTTFKIYLPLIATPAAELIAEEGPPPPGGSETILLAEDNPEVRLITSMVLREFGYQVIEATDGADAVERFSAHAQHIDLMILDVIMPRMGGREVFDAVKATKPAQKVLFASGYTADSLQRKGMFEEGVQFIPKPMSPFELLCKVREVLDQKGL